jgi:hypothetical protein
MEIEYNGFIRYKDNITTKITEVEPTKRIHDFYWTPSLSMATRSELQDHIRSFKI